MPKVSVITPVYNVETYLRQCLDSVLNQTLRDIEIICVDDGSTDGSAAILEEYAAKDSRIKVVKQENAGAGAARNAGLSVAKGEWLSILDADDEFSPNMLSEMVEAGERNSADVVACTMVKDGDIFQCWRGWAWDKLFVVILFWLRNSSFRTFLSLMTSFLPIVHLRFLQRRLPLPRIMFFIAREQAALKRHAIVLRSLLLRR